MANEDLEDGKCERCGSVVEKKPIRQWVLKITDYAERLLADLDATERAVPLMIRDTGPDAVRADMPLEERDAVVCVVKHWSEDKFLCLRWKSNDWHGLVVGGVEKNEQLAQKAFQLVEQNVEVERKNQEIEQARRALEEKANELALTSKYKSEFLANMSHEIRTPLNAVLGLSQLGVDEHDPDRLREYVGVIHRSGKTLLWLVNDILDVSKIEAGKLTLEAIPFDLLALLGAIQDTMEGAAEAKGLALQLHVGVDVPRVVVGDPLRVQQVLTNLLANAIKFTHEGRVELQVEAGPAKGELLFSVTDTGIGMTPGELAALFQPFTQADASTTRRFGGTGLGLVISRELALLMGGELRVESTPGRGSKFQLRATVGQPTPEQVSELSALGSVGCGEATAVASMLVGRRVLLVEDNPVNQLLAKRVLERVGLEVTLAEDGQVAVELACAPRAAFDALLMDIQMPRMDGYEATRVIRARLGPGCPPIIAMTAHAMQNERERCLAAGMVAHVSKPVDVAQLYALLARLFTAAGRGSAVTQAGVEARPLPSARPEAR